MPHASTAPGNKLPYYSVSMVANSLIQALVKLHEHSIIHADIKPNKLLFDIGEDFIDTHNELRKEPLQTRGEVDLQGVSYPILLPQPFRHDFEQWDDSKGDLEDYDLILNNLGHARLASDTQDYNLHTEMALRSPEVILQAGYGTGIDIWAVGLLTYELLTGTPPFRLDATSPSGVDEDHLAQILKLTAELVPSTLLERATRGSSWFSPDGMLHSLDRRF
ncbi:kinase-like protein [Artomyces pyxidatus]|uniref:Kinase-like protein n=1 Tax=Artomyces pyxidatus TaxID=48021 RepID=A0ACB8T7R9_9AGAM|nr:kinase-like protein [Artomyces pyxidatus]